MGNLEKYLDRKVSELIVANPPCLSEPLRERHRIYAAMLFALAAAYFNHKKDGPAASYPFAPDLTSEASLGGYLGHNIAAVAVDHRGHVLDFSFNHNRIFNSSVEHAESRLIRRIFSLAQVHDSWNDIPGETPRKYGTTLSDVTVYTTLESCSQCTGIMTLGSVSAVVYLQDDPGMYKIGNIIHNLTVGQEYLAAPAPISGADIDFPPYHQLNQGFAAFAVSQEAGQGPPFSISVDGKHKYSSSITSFLSTASAYEAFRAGQEILNSMTLAHPDHAPHGDALTNSQALHEARDFWHYAATSGKRGTPHRM
ncbi:MAG: deaminase [Cyanobacteria bacterium J06638_7]